VTESVSAYALWRPRSPLPFGVYRWKLYLPESDPDLITDAATLGEALAWCQEHYGGHVRRRLPNPGTFIEVFDWEQAVTWMVTRIG
jgi:hypothetical protein